MTRAVAGMRGQFRGTRRRRAPATAVSSGAASATCTASRAGTSAVAFSDAFQSRKPAAICAGEASKSGSPTSTAIRKSFAYCAEGLAKVTDAELAEQASMFGRPIPQSRAAAMVTIAMDWADHYSTAASYLRLNGILPPTAAPQK